MSTPVQIRKLTEQDLDAYLHLRLQALKSEPQSFGATYEEGLKRTRSETVNQLKATDDSFILGAFAPDLVGMVGMFRRNGEKLRHKGTIWGMYVAPAARGRSIGKTLVQRLIQEAISLSSYEQLLLTVVTSNQAARNLYAQLGFKTYGIESKALKINNAYLDEDLMELTL